MNALVQTGRAWKLGDDVASDALINAKHAFEFDPRILRKHLAHVKTGVPGMAYLRLDPAAEWPAHLAIKVPQ